MASGFENVTLRIDAYGGTHEIRTRIRVGSMRLPEMLSLARTISDRFTEISAAAAAAEGRAVSCRIGCTPCCMHVVPVAPVEALRLADVVEGLPKRQRRTVEERFGDARRRMADSGLIPRDARPGNAVLRSTAHPEGSPWEEASRRYFGARIPCPFLEGDSCTIYAERPLACREFNVTTPPALCATMSPLVRGIPRLVRMNEALAACTNRLLRRSDSGIPLALSLDWARANRSAFGFAGDGKTMAMELFRCIQAADVAER